MNMFGFDKENMSAEEWAEFVRREQGRAIEQLNAENQALKDRIATLELLNRSAASRHKDYPLRPHALSLTTARSWSHALIDKIFEARGYALDALNVDGSSQASLENKTLTIDAAAFKNWARAVAEIAVIAVSWLDSKGVGDKERLQLFKKIDDDWKDD